MGYLTADMSFFKFMALSQSSRRTYPHSQEKFITFCQQFKFTPYPLQEKILRLFACFLARNLSFQTIQTYLAALHFRHIELGFPDNFDAMHLLCLLLRGIRCTKGQKSPPLHQPIALNILKCLKMQLTCLPCATKINSCFGWHLPLPSLRFYVSLNSTVLIKTPIIRNIRC